ncbi:TIGR03364 family FAD-dependent oxidoreductase [Gryllotalpicola reticulitermitis]|uniref:TIGR03364 family FAD-dependent oxidoreductase n=1 Tax=Gryllotalpicola reticulitermitis TaxID=1184153 RepID=A0ABV8QCN1_9MICO
MTFAASADATAVDSGRRADVAIVGGGIVGLAHAWHAVRSGLRVVVLERDEFAVGASVRNFGHICTSAQSGLAYDYALRSREEWLAIGEAAGIPVMTAGTVAVARRPEELAVLEEFAEARGDEVSLLTVAQASDRLGFAPVGAIGAGWLPLDLRVDSPTAIPALAAYLESRGVEFHRRANVLAVEPGRVITARGEVAADRVIVAVGHDVDRFFSEIADEHGVQRCRLRMIEVDAPASVGTVDPGVFTGTSLLRYSGFAETKAAEALRDALDREAPELGAHGVNLMFTQRLPHSPEAGRLVLGDTHHYGVTETPWEDEESDELLLDQFRCLFGSAELRVRRRWRGVYASSETGPYLISDPQPGVTAVTVTSGIGMTTALGLAASVLS